MKQVPSGRFQLITFNAPLLRAPLANSDPAAASSYYTQGRGESLARDFFAELPARLAEGGEALLQAQLTPEVEATLDGLARELQVGSIRFAEAPDGTPHAIIVVRRGGEPMRRKLSVSLGPLCPAVRDRRIVDALMAAANPRARNGAAARVLAGAAAEPPAWRRSSPRPWRALRFGAHAIDDAELALLERLDGRPLSELSLDSADGERLQRLVDLGLVVLT